MNIKELLPYYKGTNILEGYYIVNATYPDTWSAYSSKDGNIQVERDKKSNGNSYIYGAKIDEVEDIDVIYALIKLTIEVNVDAEKKMELLKTSIERLKKFFTEHDVDELKRLEFTIGDKVNNKIIQPAEEIATLPETLVKSTPKKKEVKVAKIEKVNAPEPVKNKKENKVKALPKTEITEEAVTVNGFDLDAFSKEYGF